MNGADEQYYPLPNKVLVLLVLVDASTPLQIGEVSRVVARRTAGNVAPGFNGVKQHLEAFLDDGAVVETVGPAVGDRTASRLFAPTTKGRDLAVAWRVTMSAWSTPPPSTPPPVAPRAPAPVPSLRLSTRPSSKKAKKA